MRVRNHRLVDEVHNIDFIASPNIGETIDPRYLVIHYSAGSSAAGCIRWFSNPSYKASAHLVIARDGTITQMVPFNRLARHAGLSQWGRLDGLNRHSIGIELDNAGELMLSGGQWVLPVGRGDYAADEVAPAFRPGNSSGTLADGLHSYTETQLAVTLEVCLTLVHHYGLVDVLGHDNNVSMRPRDPAADLAIASACARGHNRENDATRYRTTAALNVRSGAGAEFPLQPGSPLPAGTEVEVLSRKGVWWQVDAAVSANGTTDMVGWCHSRFLAATDRE